MVIRDVTSYTKDREFKKAIDYMMGVSAAVYNELLGIVFSRAEYTLPSLAHHEATGLTRTTYSFIRIDSEVDTKPFIGNKDKKFLYNYMDNHDSDGNKVKPGSESSLRKVVKNKHAPFVQQQEFNEIVYRFWSMVTAISSRPLEGDEKQVLFNYKEMYQLYLTNCPYSSGDNTVILKNPIALPRGKNAVGAPDEVIAIKETFDKYRLIDLSKTVADDIHGVSKFVTSSGKPTIIVTSDITGDIKFIAAYDQNTQIDLGSFKSKPYKIEGSGYVLWDNAEFKKAWAKIKKKNDTLPKSEYVSQRSLYIDMLGNSDNVVMSIDPNVQRFSMAITKEGNLIKTINLDISEVSIQHKRNMRKLKGIKSRMTKASGGNTATSQEFRKFGHYMENYRTNFQHHIAVKIMEIAESFGVGHILLGEGGRSRRNMPRFPNLKNISVNTISKYMQEIARERGIILTEVNEAYTSKASFMHGEMPEKDTDFQAYRNQKNRHELNIGGDTVVDADINGACNIAVKYGVLDNAVRMYKKVRYMLHNPTQVVLDI
jgi:IS605 OrfB family transposase